MYSVGDYRDMIEDGVRAPAYARALAAAVRPGATVVEVGTGVGYFAVLACRAGATRVWAIEPDAAVEIGVDLARANGCADRIEFIRELSTRVAIGPADILLCDLRGVLPILDRHIPDVVDARERLLKPGGIQITERDTLWLALARHPRALESPPAWRPDADGVSLLPLDRVLVNNWWRERLSAAHLLSEPVRWCTLDYRTVTDPDVRGEVELGVSEEDEVAGISVWFDTELFGGHGFTNAPGAPATIYGQAFFPISPALRPGAGSRMRVTIEARLVGSQYVWRWGGAVLDGPARGAQFSHSTFFGTPMSSALLRKRADSFAPTLNREGRVQAWILARMGERRALGDIARGLMAEFPGAFRDLQDALTRVADLSASFSE